MVSSSIITNCQLSTKMIEGIHIFLVWRESWQELSPYYRWLCIYRYCFVLHHVRNGGRKCYLMQNSCIVFKSSDFSFVWISSSGFFFSLRIFVSVLKVKKYVLSSSCFFVLLVWDGLLRLGVCIGMSWLWCEDEWLLVVAFHFWEGCTMSTVKKSFLQKCRDFIGSSKKGKKKPNPTLTKNLNWCIVSFYNTFEFETYNRICSFMTLFYFEVVLKFNLHFRSALIRTQLISFFFF